MRVLGFGDNIVDRFVDRRVLYPGGNCVNVAVYARRLGADADYLGAFGSDSHARLIQDALVAEGVGIGRCVTRDGDSGITDITVNGGDRVFGGWNGGGVSTTDPVHLAGDLLDYAAGFDLVHSSVYSGSEGCLPLLREHSPLISFDLSSEAAYRHPSYLDRVCPHLDLALISASHLSPDDTRVLLADIVDRGAGLALATRGTAGAVLYTGKEFIEADAVTVPAEHMIDTMGCGDAYLSAFVMAMLASGWSRTVTPGADAVRLSLEAAAVFAAQQCTVEGAFGHGTAY